MTNYTKNYAEQPFNRWKRYSVTISVLIFLIYFCILREENDIDEMLSGSHEKSEKYKKLIDLQVKYTYCQNNKLPTKKIEDQILELKKSLNIK